MIKLTNRGVPSARSTFWHVIAPDPRCPCQIRPSALAGILQQVSRPRIDPLSQSPHSDPVQTQDSVQAPSQLNPTIYNQRRHPAHLSHTLRCSNRNLTHPPPHSSDRANTRKPTSQRQLQTWFASSMRLSDQPRQSSPSIVLGANGCRSMNAEPNTKMPAPLFPEEIKQCSLTSICEKASGFCRSTLSVCAGMQNASQCSLPLLMVVVGGEMEIKDLSLSGSALFTHRENA